MPFLKLLSAVYIPGARSAKELPPPLSWVSSWMFRMIDETLERVQVVRNQHRTCISSKMQAMFACVQTT